MYQHASSSQPLTDHREASTIGVPASESLCMNTSSLVEGPGSNALTHYSQEYCGVPSSASSVQHLLPSSGSIGGTYVLSHYTTEFDHNAQEIEEQGSGRQEHVSTRLSHPASFSPSQPTGYSAPPPLEHLPNHSSLVSNLNSSSNNSAHSVPPPLIGPADTCALESQSNLVRSHVGGCLAESGTLVLTAPHPPPPPPLQLIPLSSPSVPKLEPPSSPTVQSDSNTCLWDNLPPHCNGSVDVSSQPVAGASTSITWSSPPPLSHPYPVVSVDSVGSAVSGPSGVASHPHTPIVLYGPPQGMYVLIK